MHHHSIDTFHASSFGSKSIVDVDRIKSQVRAYIKEVTFRDGFFCVGANVKMTLQYFCPQSWEVFGDFGIYGKYANICLMMNGKILLCCQWHEKCVIDSSLRSFCIYRLLTRSTIHLFGRHLMTFVALITFPYFYNLSK